METANTKSLTPRQSDCVERLRPYDAFVSVDDQAFRHRGDWRARAGLPSTARLVVEIGCADAAFLTRVAAKRPDVAFVGIDWKYGDIVAGAARVAAGGLRNVTLVRGRAQDLGRLFAAGEADDIWLFHPEPVPQRLFGEPFLLDAHRALRDATSTVTLKTDHAGYFQASLAMLGEPHDEWPARTRHRDLLADDALPPTSALVRAAYRVAATSLDFWNDPAAQRHVADRAFAGERTAYEQRFFAKRRPIYFVDLRSLEGVTP